MQSLLEPKIQQGQGNLTTRLWSIDESFVLQAVECPPLRVTAQELLQDNCIAVRRD